MADYSKMKNALMDFVLEVQRHGGDTEIGIVVGCKNHDLFESIPTDSGGGSESVVGVIRPTFCGVQIRRN